MLGIIFLIEKVKMISSIHKILTDEFKNGLPLVYWKSIHDFRTPLKNSNEQYVIALAAIAWYKGRWFLTSFYSRSICMNGAQITDLGCSYSPTPLP